MDNGQSDGVVVPTRAGRPAAQAPAGLGDTATIANAVGFTGTQLGCTTMQTETLRFWLRKLVSRGYVWMRNGDCIGSDLEAAYAWQCYGGKIAVHPPENEAKRAYVPHDVMLPARPYLDRNKDIVRPSDIVVATPGELLEQQRSGTWSTVRFARRMNKPLLIIFPDGTYRTENGFAEAIDAYTIDEIGRLRRRVAELERAGRYIKPYLVWTVGDESPGHHPTMPSAVGAFLDTLNAQGIAAPSGGKTGTGLTVGKSPTPRGDAPERNPA